MEKVACYCQNCRAANNLGETQCRSCGTRLLLVVFPQSLKFDTNHVPSYYEDHLLERVTLLELRLAQITEQLALAYELIKRETKSIKRSRALFDNLNEDSENQLFSGEKGKIFFENKQQEILQEILDFDDNRQTELFAHLVREGFKFLQANEEKQAFQMLERAVSISPDNLRLNFFIAENLFRLDKFSEAKKYLENLFEIDAQNEKVLLLLGTIYADARQPEKARKLLSVLVENPKIGVLVNYIWGMTAAFEENWTESLAAFKECLRAEETPEIFYLIGCVYFQLTDFKRSLQFLQKAVSLDAKFADAWFMQSLIYKILKDEKNTDNTINFALESKEAGAQCLEFLKRQTKSDIKTALPFQHFVRTKNLLTKGSLRLNKLFREQILKCSIEVS